MIDFKERTELFNSFFTDQCCLLRNVSNLPSNVMLYTNNRIAAVTLFHKDIGKIIQNLNPNKVNGHGNISIHILKICGSSIYGPLELIFKEALSTGLFPSDWRKGNIVSTHKKILKTYHPISLL